MFLSPGIYFDSNNGGAICLHFMSTHSLLSNASPCASPALFRRLNRPPQVQLNLGSKSSNLNSTADLKAAIDKLSEPEDDNLEDRHKIKFKEEDLSVVGAGGAGAGGTVLKVIHHPTGLVLAKKVYL
jgi:hypothetical protein